jgi:hypothetical protein
VLGNHDVGGCIDRLEAGGIVFGAGEEDTPPQLWELRTHALLGLLVAKEQITVDELRRGIEGLAAEQYADRSYYEKWAASISLAAIDRGECLKCRVLFAWVWRTSVPGTPHSSPITHHHPDRPVLHC